MRPSANDGSSLVNGEVFEQSGAIAAVTPRRVPGDRPEEATSENRKSGVHSTPYEDSSQVASLILRKA